MFSFVYKLSNSKQVEKWNLFHRLYKIFSISDDFFQQLVNSHCITDDKSHVWHAPQFLAEYLPQELQNVGFVATKNKRTRGALHAQNQWQCMGEVRISVGGIKQQYDHFFWNCLFASDELSKIEGEIQI